MRRHVRARKNLQLRLTLARQPGWRFAWEYPRHLFSTRAATPGHCTPMFTGAVGVLERFVTITMPKL